MNCGSQTDLDLMPSAVLGLHLFAAPESAIAKLRRQGYWPNAGLVRGKRIINCDDCVGSAGEVDPVGDIFLVPEPAQFGHPQNPAIPIQRGRTSEVESKEAQNFSLIGLRHHVQ